MRTIVITVIVTALLLTVCFIISLFMGKRNPKKLRATNLVIPLIALLLFVGLFVGQSIRRDHIRKELDRMEVQKDDRDGLEGRLEVLEQHNREITWILGRDQEIEERIAALH